MKYLHTFRKRKETSRYYFWKDTQYSMITQNEVDKGKYNEIENT